MKDLYGKPAIFEEFSSSPAALEAGKLTDLYGCLMMGEHQTQKSGDSKATARPSTGDSNIKKKKRKDIKFTVEQSDAVQAYTQASLNGDETWIELPRNRWPAGWKGIIAPMVRLDLALYGHPCSGAYWEQRCDAKAISAGFKKIRDGGEWRSCYYHEGLKMLLAVYVDDSKMAGPADKMTEAWALLREGKDLIKMDDPTPSRAI